MSSDKESQIVSVERMSEYAGMQQEPPSVIEANRPPASWPSKGAVKFSNLLVRYRPGLPPVLNKVTLDINAHEKVGICGRTGSGKSTLLVRFHGIPMQIGRA